MTISTESLEIIRETRQQLRHNKAIMGAMLKQYDPKCERYNFNVPACEQEGREAVTIQYGYDGEPR